MRLRGPDRARSLPDCGRGGWGRAGRLGGPRAAKVGEDGLDREGVLDGGDNAQPAATAGTSEDIDPWRLTSGLSARSASGAGEPCSRSCRRPSVHEPSRRPICQVAQFLCLYSNLQVEGRRLSFKERESKRHVHQRSNWLRSRPPIRSNRPPGRHQARRVVPVSAPGYSWWQPMQAKVERTMSVAASGPGSVRRNAATFFAASRMRASSTAL